jgi:hypothetical protein
MDPYNIELIGKLSLELDNNSMPNAVNLPINKTIITPDKNKLITLSTNSIDIYDITQKIFLEKNSSQTTIPIYLNDFEGDDLTLEISTNNNSLISFDFSSKTYSKSEYENFTQLDIPINITQDATGDALVTIKISDGKNTVIRYIYINVSDLNQNGSDSLQTT